MTNRWSIFCLFASANTFWMALLSPSDCFFEASGFHSLCKGQGFVWRGDTAAGSHRYAAIPLISASLWEAPAPQEARVILYALCKMGQDGFYQTSHVESGENDLTKEINRCRERISRVANPWVITTGIQYIIRWRPKTIHLIHHISKNIHFLSNYQPVCRYISNNRDLFLFSTITSILKGVRTTVNKTGQGASVRLEI